MKENQYFKTEYFLNEMRKKKEAFTKGGKDPAVLYKLSYLSKNIAGTCRNVLDVGCGIGDLYHYIEQLNKNMEYVGIDSSEVEIAFSKSYFKGNDKCRFILGDVEKIPYKENSFDLIFSRDVIIHTPNPYEMIKEMVRVTNKFLIFNARVTCLSNDITLHDKEKGHRYNTFSLKKFLRFLHKLSSHSLQIGYCFSALSMPNINRFYWTRKYHYNIDFMRAGGWYFIDVMIKKNTEDKGVIIISNDTYNPRLNAMSYVKYSNMLRCLFQLFKDIVKRRTPIMMGTHEPPHNKNIFI